MPSHSQLPPLFLPSDILESYVHTSDLTYHVLSAGVPGSPVILLIHGFPDLAVSFVEIMPLLAMAGFHVLAFDGRGFGRTSTTTVRVCDERGARGKKREINYAKVGVGGEVGVEQLANDALRLVRKLGYREVWALMGFGLVGGMVARECVLMRGEVFKSLITISTPATTSPSCNHNPALLPPRNSYSSCTLAKQPYSTHPSSARTTTELSSSSPESTSLFLKQYYLARSHINPASSNSSSGSTRKGVVKAEEWDHCCTNGTTQSEPTFLPSSLLEMLTSEYTRTGLRGPLSILRSVSSPSSSSSSSSSSPNNASERISIPSLLITGDMDAEVISSFGGMEGISEGGTREGYDRWYGVRTINDCGAWPHLERPEELVSEVLGFLEGIRGWR